MSLVDHVGRPLDGLGASDAAAILGVSRWKTPLDVYNAKVDPVDETKEEHQNWGILLEPPLAARYTQETGRRLRRVGTVRSKEHPLLYAHPDRLVVGEPGVVEIKVSQSAWDEIPIYYKTQAIQQLIVTDREWVDFAVLERGQRFHSPPLRYERDRTIEADFIAELEEWWERHVVAGVPPEMDGGPGGRRYLSTIERTGAEIMATPEMAAVVEQFRRARTNRIQAEAAESRLRQEIERMMDGADRMLGPFGKISIIRYKDSTTTNWKDYAETLEKAIISSGSLDVLRGLFPDGGSTMPEQGLPIVRALYTGVRKGQTQMRPDFKQEES